MLEAELDGNTGSPPQVRGKLATIFTNLLKYRITPAGAGKTPDSQKLLAHPEDHPRRCGENCIRNSQYHRPLGSPPQVRGKQQVKSVQRRA